MSIRGGAGIPVVTVDANIWYQSFPRYLIFDLQAFQVCEFQWSDRIWEECEERLSEEPTSFDDEKLDDLYEEMVDFLGECHYLNTPKYSSQISQIKLPDPDDAHILYLAYLTGSHYLLTENLKHFPAEIAVRNRLRKVIPLDDFLCELLKNRQERFLATISQTIADMRRQRQTVTKILNDLGTKNECPKVREELDPHIPFIEARVASLRNKPF